MTPKEQAKDLVDKFLKCKDVSNSYYVIPIMEDAKQCALIAVDEIINAIDFDWMEVQNLESEHRYWDEVKEEIKKL